MKDHDLRNKPRVRRNCLSSQEIGEPFYRDIDFFERLRVPYSMGEENQPQSVTGQFNRATARCRLLMRTLLHELGHHLDLATNRRRWCSRGEEFAERIGQELERRTWSEYRRVFGDQAK